MNILIDNNLPPAFARAFDALSQKEGHRVHHLRERFEPATPDVIWLNKLAQEGSWAVISGDRAISKKPHERAAWLSSGVTAFFLAKGWNDLAFWQKAAHLVKRWPDILQQAELVDPGAGFLVPIRGRFQQVRVK